ncbi:uncharacterized protein KGF55_003032 [Candida pseudojiufengensis]|uniref:uncharacterized protein n=1 Tax=Candida pseudojiufengensis TaxID=497109 RepID=UPI0022252CC6|nr:uncharacterized protein KGF55_003032 [Candida pseudojiufengensis]KAI5963240.1 hypothetical protein KGF55_003032 [Candida pseudojiufengensis]
MSSLFSLDGQVALITGATSGIGLGYAEGLASANIKQLILTYRSEQNFEDAKTAILKLNENVKIDGIKVDFLNENEDELVEKIYEQGYKLSTTGVIDILINNAGITERYNFESFPQQKFDDVLRIDLDIPIKLTQKFGTRMLELKTKGKIVFTASLLSFQGGMKSTPYAVAKGGLKQFTQAVSNEWSSRGIRVNCIAPGYVETKLTSTMEQQNKDLVDKRIPMGRWAQPGDFRGPIVFLCSDASSYVTGETLVVDGGWLGR